MKTLFFTIFLLNALCYSSVMRPEAPKAESTPSHYMQELTAYCEKNGIKNSPECQRIMLMLVKIKACTNILQEQHAILKKAGKL